MYRYLPVVSSYRMLLFFVRTSEYTGLSYIQLFMDLKNGYRVSTELFPPLLRRLVEGCLLEDTHTRLTMVEITRSLGESSGEFDAEIASSLGRFGEGAPLQPPPASWLDNSSAGAAGPARASSTLVPLTGTVTTTGGVNASVALQEQVFEVLKAMETWSRHQRHRGDKLRAFLSGGGGLWCQCWSFDWARTPANYACDADKSIFVGLSEYSRHEDPSCSQVLLIKHHDTERPGACCCGMG
jgi:hypothetical protein